MQRTSLRCARSPLTPTVRCGHSGFPPPSASSRASRSHGQATHSLGQVSRLTPSTGRSLFATAAPRTPAGHSAHSRRSAIPTLHFPAVLYFSPEDEAAFFAWLLRIPGISGVRGLGACLHVRIPSRPSQACRRELEAISQRYLVSPTLTPSRQACPSPSPAAALATPRRQRAGKLTVPRIPLPGPTHRGQRSRRPT